MWEYRTLSLSHRFTTCWRNGAFLAVKCEDVRESAKTMKVTRILNKLGKEGWELCWVSDTMEKFLFKRNLKNQPNVQKRKVNATSKRIPGNRM